MNRVLWAHPACAPKRSTKAAPTCSITWAMQAFCLQGIARSNIIVSRSNNACVYKHGLCTCSGATQNHTKICGEIGLVWSLHSLRDSSHSQ